MKAIYHNGPAGFVIGSGDMEDARLVKLASGKVVLCTDSVSDEPVGASLGRGAENGHVSIDWINKQGTLRITAAATASREADAYQAADGKVKPLPAAASDISAWESGTVYAEGDLVKPTSGNENEHYYKCTAVTGDAQSHDSTEPTWPTDGSTVDDDNVTWEDQGTSKFRKVGKFLQAASGDGSVVGVLPYDLGTVTDIAE